MNFKLGDPSIIDKLSNEQLKNYWHELKMSRYDSHFYIKLLDKVRSLNPNLVLPDDEEIEKIKNEALNLALWEENWEIKNKERIKGGGTDYSLFRQNNTFRPMNNQINNNLSVNA